MHGDLLHITADDREVGSGVVKVLQDMSNVDLTVRRLPLGDYKVEGSLLFERKTFLDLTASIKDGRLFQQALRLASAPASAAIILEGTTRDLSTSKMRREALQGALISVTLFGGLPLLRARHPEETTRLMLYAARQSRRFASGPLPRYRSGSRPRGKRRTQLHLLQGLPGVGPKRAEQLLDAFGSVEAVFCAEIDDLAAVPGIGTCTAEKIQWAVRERSESYNGHSAGIQQPAPTSFRSKTDSFTFAT